MYFAVREGSRGLRGRGPHGQGASLTVLTYHAIRSGDVERFDRQMRELARHSMPVFADREEDGSGGRCVAVTFDDGFQCVLDHALRVMQAHGVPATIFVPTGYLGRAPGWVREAYQNAKEPVATAEALAALDPGLCRLGSHSVTHPSLAEVPPEALESELRESKRDLERISGRPVEMLSLPFGSCSAAVLEAAQKCGYRRVFLNVPVRRTAPAILSGRVNTSPDDWDIEFRLKIVGAYQWLAAAAPVKRTVERALRGKRSHRPSARVAGAK